MGADMSINDFVSAFRQVFPDAEYKAVKDGQVFTSSGWIESKSSKEFPATTAPKEKVKNDSTRRR